MNQEPQPAARGGASRDGLAALAIAILAVVLILFGAKKLPELVCSPAVAQAAHDYTLALHGLIRGQLSVDSAPAKRELRFAFLEAARKELGTPSGPLRREGPSQEPQDG